MPFCLMEDKDGLLKLELMEALFLKVKKVQFIVLVQRSKGFQLVMDGLFGILNIKDPLFKLIL